MKLFYSTTSPFARLARLTLMEKGIFFEGYLTDPWKDDPALLAANPCARVPTLELDDGRVLTESLLILLTLENEKMGRSLLGADPIASLSQAGLAIGGIEAAAAIIIGSKADGSFGESPVGLRRRRSIVDVLRRLEDACPSPASDVPDIAVTTAVVFIDYIHFRFSGSAWLPETPKLDALAVSTRSRPAFAETMPQDMPTV